MSWQKYETNYLENLSPSGNGRIYIGVSKYTALNNLKKYKLVYEYNPRDIYSVSNFLRFLLRKRSRPE